MDPESLEVHYVTGFRVGSKSGDFWAEIFKISAMIVIFGWQDATPKTMIFSMF